jgi:hypothetical protein
MHHYLYTSPEAFHTLLCEPQLCLLVVCHTVAEELPLPRSGGFYRFISAPLDESSHLVDS